jgi:membrane-bound lytic murein transglycosylase MltF
MDRTLATLTLACVLAWVPAIAGAGSTPNARPPEGAPVGELTTEATAWTGDFDGMLERRRIRVLVPFSRSLFFNDRGRERGISADTVRGFEAWLNEKYAKQLRNRPITVLIVPTTRDRLLPNVASGLGDIAVGNLTVTEERGRLVDFASDPAAPTVNEIVVTGPKAPAITTVEELSGKTVHVRRASSYFESLTALNARLVSAGAPPVNVVLVPDALEDEDILEMVDAGMLAAAVVDDWKARMWAQVLPHLKLNEQAVLRTGGVLGWATRKDSPKLRGEILGYMKEVTRGVITGRVEQYTRRVKRLRNPTKSADEERFEQLLALFEKYGERYRFDPLMLAAQGYQESQLNQNARSDVGAIGIMQVMPATGEALGVGDIRLSEPNIHAGAKYMDQLMKRYFRDADLDDVNRTLFAFASYNAGPGAIAKMRDEAAKSGFDPNQWFNNVEVVTARRIGLETTTYVRNIYKYYVAYKLMAEMRATEKVEREQLTPAK